MINGSQQIIGNVPGQYLNPLLVAESQAADHTGFIVVTYELDPRQYDVLFLQGRVITHCARMNKDLRFFIDQLDVTTTFRDRHSESMVSLFMCDRQNIQRFIATFHSEPCLKVHVDALTKLQILALIKSTGCSQGIIERNDFSTSLPIIELKEIESAGELPLFSSGFKRGRLLVYDLLKNQEIQSHRFAPATINNSSLLCRKRSHKSIKPQVEAASTPPFCFPESRSVTESERAGKSRSSGTVKPQTVPEAPDPSLSLPTNPAEAIEALANEILASDQLTIEHCPLTVDNPSSGLQSSVNNQSPVSNDDQQPTITDQRATNNDQPDPNDQPQSPQPGAPPAVQPSVEEAVPAQEPGHAEPSHFTRVLERVFRSVKQQIVEASPQRAESIFAQAEKKILMLNPDFDVRALDNATAIVTLDLIEEIIKQSPLLKRSRLRESAAELVSDLYNKQYELLEDHNAVDAVEQCYYRLKGSKS